MYAMDTACVECIKIKQFFFFHSNILIDAERSNTLMYNTINERPFTYEYVLIPGKVLYWLQLNVMWLLNILNMKLKKKIKMLPNEMQWIYWMRLVHSIKMYYCWLVLFNQSKQNVLTIFRIEFTSFQLNGWKSFYFVELIMLDLKITKSRWEFQIAKGKIGEMKNEFLLVIDFNQLIWMSFSLKFFFSTFFCIFLVESENLYRWWDTYDYR